MLICFRKMLFCGSRRDGTTLVEMMVASSIMLIVSIGLTYGIISAIKTHTMANVYYRATCMARNRIQRARCMDFASLPTLLEDYRPVDEYGDYDLSGQYRRTTTVSNISSDCAEVAVNVYFPYPHGRISRAPIEVKTIIAYGM